METQAVRLPVQVKIQLPTQRILVPSDKGEVLIGEEADEEVLLPNEEALLSDEEAVLYDEEAEVPDKEAALLDEEAVLPNEEAVQPERRM
jgi:hypothetical protein